MKTCFCITKSCFRTVALICLKGLFVCPSDLVCKVETNINGINCCRKSKEKENKTLAACMYCLFVFFLFIVAEDSFAICFIIILSSHKTSTLI